MITFLNNNQDGSPLKKEFAVLMLFYMGNAIRCIKENSI
jgi:hypothetical protein